MELMQMASVHRKQSRATKSRGTVTYEIRFFVDGVRRSYFPGPKTTKKTADSIGAKLDHLANASANNEAPPPSVSEWVSKLNDKQHAKLAGWGLVQPRSNQAAKTVVSLNDWTRRYIKRGKRKDSTNGQLEDVARNLTTFFGRDKPICEFTAGDAEDFRIWLETEAREATRDETPKGLAKNTVRRRIGRAREFFNLAVKHNLIKANPFADEAVTVSGNPDRQFFVPADWIERCIQVANCEDWRIMLAFARYAGMRSHETRLQRWEDIDIPRREMIVRSNKTPPTRVCPIFPELMPHLVRAKEMAPDGAELVVSRYTPEQGINETFKKIVKRAGLSEWPKLMQNLRATRETELMAVYPITDVASWLGNSKPTAIKHYAMTMKSSFERAIVEGAILTQFKAPHKAPHNVATLGNQGQSSEWHENEKGPQNTESCEPLSAADNSKKYRRRDSNPHWIAPTGF
tara:strand:- start:22673 stop:24049 length:1377 start_codon:yes stop_codon:yes gene_type:complete